MAHFYQYHVYLRGRALIQQHTLQSVLDIGCGPAFKLETLIAPVCQDIVGLDEPGIIDYCQSRFGFARFISYDIERAPFPLDRTFDLIICSDVIEHLVNPDKLLADIRSASTDKSLILLSTPERDELRGKGCMYSPKAMHVREWNYDEFAAYLASRGFLIEEHTLVPPLKFNWSRELFELWFSQLRTRRNFASCQMVVCKKVNLAS